MRPLVWTVSMLGASLMAPMVWAFDGATMCVELRKKVDAFTWANNPFKNPGDLLAVQKAFGRWPLAVAAGRMAVIEPGCYAELQVTAAGQVASAVFHGGDPLATPEKPDARPEMRQALIRLKSSLARMQAEIEWLEAQLGEEVPVTRPAPARKETGVKITGDAQVKHGPPGSSLQ